MINSKQLLSVILLKPIQNLIIYSNITDLSYSSVTFLFRLHRKLPLSFIFITMSSPKPQQHNLKSLLSQHVTVNKQHTTKLLIKVGYIAIVTIIVFLLSIPVIYMLGSKRVHRHNMNMLYDIFENSPQHVELYEQLSKAKYGLVYGDLDGGVFNFMDHFANKQSLKQRNVIVQDFHSTVSMFSDWIQQLKYFLQQFLDLQDKFKNIWILQSRTGQNIPKTAILKIIHRYPKDKIFIVITRKQKLPSFQVFQYPSITQHDVKQSIEKNFQMDENTADILYDFFGTPEAALAALDIGHYSQEELLGDNYRELIEFEQQDVRILRDLCKHGEAKVESISEDLVWFGLMNHQNQTYWANRYFMLNYELHKKIRCSDDGVATDEELFEVQQDLEAWDIEKTEEELMEQEVWNEDQIFEVGKEVLQKPKKKGKKGKKSKKAE